jgi:ribonuclease BN (tRNA processing enzyme)
VLAHLEVLHRAPAEAARPGSDAARARRRTEAWDAALAGASPLALDGVPVTGAPPREASWRGRQVVLLDAAGRTLALGEVEAREGPRLWLRASPVAAPVASVVVRDAWRDERGLLRSAPRPAPERPPPGPVEGTGTRGVPLPTRRGGRRARPVLMNGLFGDPMLHVRLARGRRSMLVDAGACADLPSRIAHQVTDVFATHAHMDHFAGLAWLLRRRVHTPAPCRVVGPPGTAARVAALCDAFTWDRVGRDGPRFLVGDFEGEVVRWSEVRAGRPLPEALDATPAPGGCVYAEEDVRVSAVSLDHGTRVLAWRYEDRGQVVVYATDLADTPENRAALVDLARGADVLVLEAHFAEADAAKARATRHLTTRACAEIAAAADVGVLVPFHFSVRYEREAARLYAEIASIFPRLFDLRR